MMIRAAVDGTARVLVAIPQEPSESRLRELAKAHRYFDSVPVGELVPARRQIDVQGTQLRKNFHAILQAIVVTTGLWLHTY